MKIHLQTEVMILRKISKFRNFAKFTGKHPCQSLFFSKVAGLRPDKILPIIYQNKAKALGKSSRLRVQL